MEALLKLKLDMLYKDLPVEEARLKFAEIVGAPQEVPAPVVEPVRRKRRVVTGTVPST